jgi:hypothetical protein
MKALIDFGILYWVSGNLKVSSKEHFSRLNYSEVSVAQDFWLGKALFIAI